jgi:predicted enzyme related to lactoylglutathione lyase
MHKSRLGELVIDCEGGDIDAHAEFWAGALGRTVEAAPKNPRYRRLFGRDGEIGILLQAAEHAPRVHLDIETDDRDSEVARLEKLGARVVETFENWTVMEAVTGHRFCVVRVDLSAAGDAVRRWE